MSTAVADNLRELAAELDPRRTVLFLGAGASAPSGAPTGPQLAERLAERLVGEVISSDLMETASILEMRCGRDRLVAATREVLAPLSPTGGLLALPSLPWAAIYTTNFDQLVEQAYAPSRQRLVVVRSNFDYHRSEDDGATTLYKIHGCISQDRADGSAVRLVLTERDYAECASYRQVLFRNLALAMATKDIVVVGYSMRDPHLKRELDEAARLHAEEGGAGRIFALVHDLDPDRAALLEQKGYRAVAGDIDRFMYAVADVVSTALVKNVEASLSDEHVLPSHLCPVTVDTGHAARLGPVPARLFNGSPATYADIRSGLTIERSGERRLARLLAAQEKRYLVLTGVAGVGKTTMARGILQRLRSFGRLTWEHRSEFPLRPSHWEEVEYRLRMTGQRGVLLIDEAPPFLRSINALVDRLSHIDDPHLQLILTGNTAQWGPRIKSPFLFAKGQEERLSTLQDGELEALVALTERRPEIRSMMDPRFARLSRHEQVQRLRRRCGADMYVCLKNIFAFDALDTILLREYAELNEPLRDIYRHVAALEALGGQVHRQLIVRLLGIKADQVSALSQLLEGIVDEFDIDANDGVFGWSTRHRVVAQTIARYKFSDEDERFRFFRTVIQALNPALWLELRMLRDLCDRNYGIGSLTDVSRQLDLLYDIIAVAPGERVPRHRLVGVLINSGDLDSADKEARLADDAVGLDPPLSRQRVRIAIRRAQDTKGILKQDRRAMLREAGGWPLHAISQFGDKNAYMSYIDVGAAVADVCDDGGPLNTALALASAAFQRILDPELEQYIHNFELRARRRAPLAR